MASDLPSLSRLPQATRTAIAAARAQAVSGGQRLYLVGGVVRDLFLRREVRDLDLVVDGDGARFAEALAARLGAACKLHPRFGTAILSFPDGRRLDIAATRREGYAHAGALPSVSLGASIEEDLWRRDFTVNAMAMEIAPQRGLVDPFGGRADLESSVLRSLHETSFSDDPTRALRGVRYGQRLGFRLAPQTRRAIGQAVSAGAFEAVSGQRLAREIVLLLSEPGRGGSVDALRRLGVAGAIVPVLGGDPSAGRRVGAAETIARDQGIPVTWLCYLLAWMGAAGDSPRVAERLALAGRDAQIVRAWASTWLRLGEEPALAARRNEVSLEESVAAAASSEKAVSRALLAAVAAAPVTLSIRGTDLIAAGVAAGPAIGRALAETLRAREENRIAAAGELAFAIHAARRGPGNAR